MNKAEEAWEKMKSYIIEEGYPVNPNKEKEAKEKFFAFLKEYVDEDENDANKV